MATINDQGITGRSLNEYLTDLRNAWLAIDPAFNIDPDSPDGQIIGILSELFANLDEGLIEAYNSKDPDRATGEALSTIGKFYPGIERKEATFSVAPLTIYGTSGAVFQAGSIVRSNVNDVPWMVNSSIVIGQTGSGTGFVTSSVSGPVNAEPGELTVIGTPTSGVTSVTNLLAATQGAVAETDTAYRIRRTSSVGLNGNNQLDSLRAAIANVAGVTDYEVFENDTDTTDANGIPRNSISLVVNGGSDMAIAAAMYQKKNPGVRLYGGTSPVEVDYTSPETGNMATMRFQRAQAVPIYVSMNIKRKGGLPENIESLIAQAIIEDAQKTLLNGQTSLGFNQGGYSIGEVVPVGRLYTPANKVLGQFGDSYVTSITIGTSSSNMGSSPIQPAYNQLATFNAENISVTVTP